MAPRLDVGPLADEIAQRILTGNRRDPRLAWKPNGSVVVKTGTVLPKGLDARKPWTASQTFSHGA